MSEGAHFSVGQRITHIFASTAAELKRLRIVMEGWLFEFFDYVFLLSSLHERVVFVVLMGG